MPAPTVAMLEGRGTETVERLQKEILTSYTLDFSKHAPARDIPRIASVWESVPSQLSRENRKFLYKVVKPGARAREYEDALLWLQQAGLTYRTFCATRPGLPLSAYDDLSAFKVYLCDTGLLRAMSGLPSAIFTSESPLYREFKGALAENAVLQSLVAQFDVQPRYWVSSGSAEVDFLLQTGLQVVPVEVKAASNTAGKSLSVYMAKYKPETAVVFSLMPPTRKGTVLHLPLFLADWLKHVVMTENC